VRRVLADWTIVRSATPRLLLAPRPADTWDMTRRGAHRMQPGLRARLRAEDGFTLPELMVVVILLPIVLIGLLKALDTQAKLTPQSVQYANAVEDAGVGISRVMRDLRSATRVVGTTPNTITFDRSTGGSGVVRITLSCDVPVPAGTWGPAGTYRRCVKVTVPFVGNVLGTTSATSIVVDRLINGTTDDPVFTFTPNAIFPNYISMKVRVPSRGEDNKGFTHPVVIDNGTLLRNNVLGS
jgi:prepilin-type N-terminal cleavage/methylation domain-containing protein